MMAVRVVLLPLGLNLPTVGFLPFGLTVQFSVMG
jgi:hypothetical protein